MLNNALKYTDPSGYFSEEQLNWLGYFKDSTSEDIWAFLLTLQPGDFIGGATQNDLWALIIGQRAYNENAAFGLWLGRGDESVELAEWLSNQADLHDVWAYRFEVEQEARVWNAALPIRGTFYGSHAQLCEQPNSLLVTTKQRASLLRSLSEAWESALGSMPKWLGKLLEANNIASSDVPAGHLKGDVRMMFTYYDSLTVNITNRTVWLRQDSEFSSMTIISDEWVTFSPSSP